MGGAWISQVADWQNSSVIEINKRRAHVPLKSYTSPSQPLQHYASISATPASPRVLVLNGEHWRFKLFDRPEDVPQAFHDPQHPDQDWAQVRPAAGRSAAPPCAGAADQLVAAPVSSYPPPPPPAPAGDCADQLGVPGVRAPPVHQLCIPLPGGASLCAGRQPDRMLPPALRPADDA